MGLVPDSEVIGLFLKMFCLGFLEGGPPKKLSSCVLGSWKDRAAL